MRNINILLGVSQRESERENVYILDSLRLGEKFSNQKSQIWKNSLFMLNIHERFVLCLLEYF